MKVTQVLSISKSVWSTICRDHPLQARRILENLQSSAENDLLEELATCGLSKAQLKDKGFLEHIYTFAYTGNGAGRQTTLDAQAMVGSPLDGLSDWQKQIISTAVHIRNLVKTFVRKVKQNQTNEFLSAASNGDVETLKQLLLQGLDINSCDHDSRTALMIASRKGNVTSVGMLIDAGADSSLCDGHGHNALLEASLAGHDQIIDLLVQRSTLATLDSRLMTSILFTSIIRGDNPLLERLIRAGADVSNLVDWNGRTLLHIAASEGYIFAVQTIVELTDARLDSKDKFGSTPLDDAKKSGSLQVAEYLEKAIVDRPHRPLPSKAQPQQPIASSDRSELRSIFSIGSTTSSSPFSQDPVSSPSAFERISSNKVIKSEGQEAKLVS